MISNQTRKIIELLRLKHEKAQWACFVEITAGTGSAGFNRRFDFYAFNIWPSGKYHRIVYEIKVSRSDFNAELSRPGKREAAEVLANECFFVLPVGMVRVDEIPEGWGLIELTKGGLRKKKNAMWRDIGDLPIWYSAAIARRVADEKPKLPKAIWIAEGKELTEESLEEYINSKVLGLRREIRDQITEEMEKKYSDSSARLRKLENVLRSQVGWHFSDPDNLLEWFKANIDRDLDQSKAALFAMLRRLRDQIDKLIEE